MKPSFRIKRLAIVLQNASTGGWRYTERLVEGLRIARPDCEVLVYIGRSVKSEGELESPREVLRRLGADVRSVPWLRPVRNRSGMKLVVSKLRTLLSSTSYCRWIEELNRCDAVFFAWPYGIECPPCKAPVAFIPHDFNYTHFVGTFVESPASVASLRSQHKLWLERAHPIVSTQFIADELMRTFPEYVSPPRVVRLSQLGPMESMNHDEASKIVQRLGISGDYLLSLNNISAHKNLGQLLSGFHYVAKQYPNLKLVLVGFGTEGIHGNVNSPYYLDWSDSGGNVQSLGLRSDREVSALIARAKLVVNASLYEAGNGSGLDAWRMGTPVVMSDIPAFVEQLHAMDVRAETFNPRCCYEIRDALLRIMQQPEVAEANASYSKKSMSRYSWNDVAEHYLDFFDEIAAKTSHPLDH